MVRHGSGYLVYNVIRTADGVSPVTGGQVGMSLAAFVIVYGLIFGAATYYILKLIAKGPEEGSGEPTYGAHGVEKPLMVTDIAD